MENPEPTDEELLALPDHFYKYRDFGRPEHLKAAILEHKFFFDSPNNFNDPFECLPSFTFDATEAQLIAYYKQTVARQQPTLSDYRQTIIALKYRLEAPREHQPGTPEYRKYHRDMWQQLILPKLPMFCLSATSKNVLLWSHYAWNHTGVCLQFNANALDVVEAQRVVYQKDRARVNLIVKPPSDELMESTVLIKSQDWEYEREWRVIKTGQKPGIQTFKPETLTGIIFGHRTTREHKVLVEGWLKERSAPVNLMQAEISMDSYEVDIYDI